MAFRPFLRDRERGEIDPAPVKETGKAKMPLPTGVKELIVDFDGTVVDSSPIFTECMNRLGNEFGYGKIEAGSGLRDKSAYEFFTENLGLSSEQLPEWTDRFKALLKPAMKAARPFKGMKEVLGRLSTHYRVTIFTSNSEEVVRYLMMREGFRPPALICAEIPILGKDRALGALLLSEGLSPSETIYIGDEVRDIEACRNAGIKIVSVCWGFNSRASLERRSPDYLVESPQELLELLLPPHSAPVNSRRP
jgi:phosphoglycolate phosphatase